MHTDAISDLFFLAGLDIVLCKANASIQNMCGKGDGLNVNGRVCVQMSSAHEIAQSFSSSNPYFVRIMKSFNISGSYTLVGSSLWFCCFFFLYCNAYLFMLGVGFASVNFVEKPVY